MPGPGNRVPKLTPRHLAVLGVLQLAPGAITPEAIAGELAFEVAEVMRLLDDLQVLDDDRRRG